MKTLRTPFSRKSTIDPKEQAKRYMKWARDNNVRTVYVWSKGGRNAQIARNVVLKAIRENRDYRPIVAHLTP